MFVAVRISSDTLLHHFRKIKSFVGRFKMPAFDLRGQQQVITKIVKSVGLIYAPADQLLLGLLVKFSFGHGLQVKLHRCNRRLQFMRYRQDKIGLLPRQQVAAPYRRIYNHLRR